MYSLINEGAKILDEKIALRASDVDTVWINGYGFPAHRGGPMFYADTVGLARVLERVNALSAKHGKVWTPSKLLEKLAAAGRTFRYTAREILALSAWHAGDSAARKHWFDLILTDPETPDSVRSQVELLAALVAAKGQG